MAHQATLGQRSSKDDDREQQKARADPRNHPVLLVVKEYSAMSAVGLAYFSFLLLRLMSCLWARL